VEEFANAPFSPTLSDDRQSVEIAFGGTSINLTTEQLQSVLLWLGLLRSKMTPAVPTEPTRQSTVFASNWFFPAVPLNQVGHLALRTAEFGWAVIPLGLEDRQLLAAASLAVPVGAPKDGKRN
jgi:hypothetical protein